MPSRAKSRAAAATPAYVPSVASSNYRDRFFSHSSYSYIYKAFFMLYAHTRERSCIYREKSTPRLAKVKYLELQTSPELVLYIVSGEAEEWGEENESPAAAACLRAPHLLGSPPLTPTLLSLSPLARNFQTGYIYFAEAAAAPNLPHLSNLNFICSRDLLFNPCSSFFFFFFFLFSLFGEISALFSALFSRVNKQAPQ